MEDELERPRRSDLFLHAAFRAGLAARDELAVLMCLAMHRCPNCVKPNTLILGDNKAIGEFEVGDACFGENGLSNVEAVFSRQYDGDLVKIKASGLLPIEVTPEHPILVASGMHVNKHIDGKQHGVLQLEKPTWKEAKDVVPKKTGYGVKGDYVVLPVLQSKFDTEVLSLAELTNPKHACRGSLSLRLTEDVAWLLGLYVAEGFSGGDNGICFCLGRHEKELAKKACTIIESLGYTARMVEVRTSLQVWLSSRILGTAFPIWCGPESLKKKIPEFILAHQNKKILQSFIEGYEVGDGCTFEHAESKKKSMKLARHGYLVRSISTSSNLLALQLQLAHARLGRFVTVYRVAREGKARIEGRTVNIHDLFLIRYMLTCQKNATRQIGNFFLTPIRKVEHAPYNGKVANIKTADGTYLVSNAIVHNCESKILAGANYCVNCGQPV